MDTALLSSLAGVDQLVKQAQESDEPVVVLDGEDECLIAMRPAVFERVLFDTSLVNIEGGENLRL